MASGTLSVAPVRRVTASDLRFRLDETLEVLSVASGARCNPEAGVHLHELTEGWPLGVQLAAAALNRGGDLDSLLAAATADIQHYFVESLIDHQSTEAEYLLVRLAQFDLVHPDLCTAVLGRKMFADELMRLVDETPLVMRAEGGDWMRLHPLAREVLRERLDRLPASERQVLAREASRWYAQHDLVEEAAQQAFLAGDVEAALSLAEHTTYAMTVQGRSTAVLSWYGRLSAEEVRQRPGFWSPVAWAFAMSDHPAQAQPLVDLILAQPNGEPSARFEAVLIQAVMAEFADRMDLMARTLQDWPEPPAYARPEHVPIYMVVKATHLLAQGHPDQARICLLRIAALDRQQAYSPVSYGFGDVVAGLCYLWEGRYALAEQVLRSALSRAEERFERRHPLACMIAALLAQASWESGQTDDAAALLAGRMDILERLGLPDALMAAYRTLARVADHGGRQDQALSLLESLSAIGQDRTMSRLQALAQFELVRLHARRGRTEMARSLSAQLDALVRSQGAPTPDAVVHWLDLHAQLARAHALLAHEAVDRLPEAQQAIEAATRLATQLKRTGDLVEARLLHAEVLRRNGAPEARTVLNEALSLAQAEGMLRLVRDQGVRSESISPSPSTADPRAAAREPQAQVIGLLTAKEGEVLTLMSRNLSNKEIALAMGISEQTIKWHVKNLLHKLNAANRKHAVARARLLALIEG
jgi:LuxR family maltose regulon positive regulatory protein